ncbi:MAG TPA: hypothetical protein VD791_06620, partial [Burkholderiales bacterium]|nr:hypothetical protein [Burkholderiales bacterium]
MIRIAQLPLEAMRFSRASPAAALALRPADLEPLDFAILSTVAYRDQFGFAPTLDEIHRYLHWIACDRTEVAQALSDGRLVGR